MGLMLRKRFGLDTGVELRSNVRVEAGRAKS